MGHLVAVVRRLKRYFDFLLTWIKGGQMLDFLYINKII